MTSTPERPTRDVTDSARTAGRAYVSLLRDGGYAAVGATDAAVAHARRLGARATEVRDELRSLRLPDLRTVTESIRGLGAEVEQQFETYAGRGREVVASLQGDRATRTATERVDGAHTPVEEAPIEPVDVARSPVEEAPIEPVDVARSPVEEAPIEPVDVARSSVAPAVTNVPGAGEVTGEAVEAAADQVGGQSDYDAMTVEELRRLARERDIQDRFAMTKAELISALRDS